MHIFLGILGFIWFVGAFCTWALCRAAALGDRVMSR